MALLRDNRDVSLASRSRSRSHLAIFRLVPWLRPTRTSDDEVETYFYTDSSGQNPLEIRSVALLFNLTWILLICGTLSHAVEVPAWLWPIAFAASSLATAILIVAIMGLVEPFTRWLSRARGVNPAAVHSFFQQAILFVAALEAAFDAHWVKWVGQAWLALLAIELIARLVELVFRREEAESSAG